MSIWIRYSFKEAVEAYYRLVKNRSNESYEDWQHRIELYEELQAIFKTDGKMGFDGYRREGCYFCKGAVIQKASCCKKCSQERVFFGEVEPNKRYGYSLWRRGLPLYVGIAVEPHSRFRQHTKDKWIDSMKIEMSGTSDEVEEWEKRFISQKLPFLNRQLFTLDGEPYQARHARYLSTTFRR